MNKIVVLVVVLLAAAAAGLPPIVGGSTESTLRTHIAQMDENPMFAIQVAEYDRGWFSSQARIEVSIDENYAELLDAGADASGTEAVDFPTDQTISIPVDIAHGPVILMNGPYFGWSRLHAVLDDSDDLIASATEELGLEYLAELHGQVSFLGTFSFDGNVPPIEYLDESGQLSFSGFNTEGTFRNSTLITESELERLEMDSAGTALTVANLTMESDTNRINHLLWSGDFDAEVETVMITDTLAGADGAIELAGLRFAGNADLDDSGELLDMAATYAADIIRIPSEDSEVTDAELTIGFANMSVEGLTNYYETMLAFDPNRAEAAAMALSDIATSILEHNPAISLDPIRFTLDGEPLTAAVTVQTVNTDQGNLDLSNWLVLLGLIEASAELNASKNLIQQIAREAAIAQARMADPTQLPPGDEIEAQAAANADFMLISLITERYLIEDGDNYKTEIGYANGDLRINGMPFPLGGFL